jgi:hypothetical protein
MCFVLYAGTRSPLPRREWQKDAPGLSVKSLSDRDAQIKAHFSSPAVQYIGSTSRCGCDFPHATLQNGEWPEIVYAEYVEQDEQEVGSDNYNRRALVDLLRKSGETTVELYGVWDGDFAEEPQANESIPIERILEPTFRFKERGMYRVAIDQQSTPEKLS